MTKYYLCIFFTIGLNLYAHLALKIAANNMFPSSASININNDSFLTAQSFYKLCLSPWVISSFIASFIAVFCWIFAISKLPLSYAYPFLAVSFVGILFLGHFVFLEEMSWQKIVGVTLISIGIIVSAHG